MRKAIWLLLACLTLAACGCLGVSASDDGSIVIPYAEKTPVIDGVAMGGEYPGQAVVMNDHTAEAWVGDVSRETSTVWNFAWNEKGIYVFATVKDSTPSYRGENTNWVGIDCVEIGLNPGYILNKPGDKGVFFSMGATADGRVVVYRHNYDEKIVSAEVEGCAKGHVEGSLSYTVEVCIPWSLIFIEADCTKTDTHLDATRLTPGGDMIMDMVLATIDADESGNILAAYKMEGTDFVTGKYLPAYLAGAASVETAETVGSSAPIEPVTQPEAATKAPSDLIILPPAETLPEAGTGEEVTEDTPYVSESLEETAPSGGCGGTICQVGWLIPVAALLTGFGARKKKMTKRRYL